MTFLTKTKAGYMLAALVYILDQGSKIYIRNSIVPESTGTVFVTPFLNIVHAWNTGVSFSLFSESTDTRRFTLIGIMSVICLAVMFWLHHARNYTQVIAYGLILGGAIGNIADRVVMGAVFDFLQFHLAEYYWPSFNVADSAIVTGVGLLLIDGYLNREKKNANA